MSDGDGLRLDGDAGHLAAPALGDHVVEQHRVHAPEQQIAVRMHVIVVRHGLDVVAPAGAEQDLVCEGSSQRGHASPGQV